MKFLRLVAAFAILAAPLACGSDSAHGTATPATPTAPAQVTYTLAGVLSDATSGQPIHGGTVAITNGVNANHSSSTDDNGYYSIAPVLAGDFVIHASAPGFNATDKNVSLSATMRMDIALQPAATPPTPTVTAAPPPPPCDPNLWNHVHDPKRLQIIKNCITVTGVIEREHQNGDGDGDEDMLLNVDAQFKNLLNSGNISRLGGNLQVECVCQAPVKPSIPDAVRACKNFTGSVLIPPVGARVQVTGTYVIDNDHGWMEIHPTTAIAILP